MIEQMAFISGKFFDLVLPREYRYLDKYFTTDIQRQFVRYWFTFNTTRFFTIRTGFRCRRQHLEEMTRRLKYLEATRKRARDDMDFDTLRIIEAGKFDWARRRK